MSSLLFAPVVGIIFAILIMGAGLVLQRAFDKPDKFAQQLGQADILNRMWFPLQDELSDVVKAQGRVTEAASAWTTAPGLSKKETPRAFYRGMQEYVGQRRFVASLAGGDLATEESRQQLVAEQQKLLFRAQELLEEVNRAINAIPGAETAARRTRRARPRPAAQRTRSAAIRPSAGTRQPAPVSRSIQAQRITDTPTKPSAPPPRITYTPMPSPPEPAPREPEPPSLLSVAPAPSPVTASVPEPDEVAPSPSAPAGDLRLDVASVCEDLFDPKMMSYATNRLFDDKYKDATVRWKGTARRASTYSYDFEFGDGGGTKAELDVYEVKQQYGSRMVKAFVQLPIEAAADIGARTGEDIEFEGRLMTCEGSARRLYVADARMVD